MLWYQKQVFPLRGLRSIKRNSGLAILYHSFLESIYNYMVLLVSFMFRITLIALGTTTSIQHKNPREQVKKQTILSLSISSSNVHLDR